MKSNTLKIIIHQGLVFSLRHWPSRSAAIRRHLGHDLMGSISARIAIEGGTIAEIGWNKYGDGE